MISDVDYRLQQETLKGDNWGHANKEQLNTAALYNVHRDLHRGKRGRGAKLTIHLYLVSWLRLLDIYLHSTMRLEGVVLKT
jgi:hypothetical protein